MTAPQRHTVIDTRVARSPVVALRFHLDTRAADLREALDEVERRLIEATARRQNLMRRLRHNEDARRSAFADPASPATLVRAMHDGLALVDDLSRTEQAVHALKQAVDDLTGARAALRELSESLRDVAPPDATFDEHAGRLSRAARSIFQLVDEELDSVAANVLDGPLQRLAEASFEAELAEQALERDAGEAAAHAARCREHAAGAAAALEDLALRIHPVSEDRGLIEALRELLSTGVDGQAVRLRVIGSERRLAPIAEAALYRIVEEAAGNAVRHAGASRIEVVVAFHPDGVSLLVKDDGEGFDVAATEARLGRTGGIGLIAMQEHAAMLGTKLELRSMAGAGTEVRVTLRMA